MDNFNSYRENIRRLAKDDRIKGGLESIREREAIDGFLTPFDDSAFAPDSNAGAGTDGGIDGDDPNSMIEPDPNDPSNPNNDQNAGGGNGRDPTKDGPQDIDDLLDDKAGPVIPDNNSDPFSGGSLNKITGLQDCDTGQCVTMHLDGVFPNPDNWDDPSTPPLIEGWAYGKRWRSGSFTFSTIVGHYLTKNLGIPPAEDYFNQQKAIIDDAFGRSFTESIRIDSATEWVKDYRNDGGGLLMSARTLQVACSPGTAVCPSTQPYETEWPEDGCYDVAMIDGQVQANQYDGEAPASAQEERSAAKFCTAGGKEVVIRAAADGKTMIYPVTASGAPTGIVKTYNSDGTLSSAGDASQQNIDSQLPR